MENKSIAKTYYQGKRIFIQFQETSKTKSAANRIVGHKIKKLLSNINGKVKWRK